MRRNQNGIYFLLTGLLQGAERLDYCMATLIDRTTHSGAIDSNTKPDQ
jgi:hypothetical protein